TRIYTRPAKWVAVAVLWLLVQPAMAQTVNPAGESSPWLQEHLLNSKASLPFSFVYGRESSQALLKRWPEKTATRELDRGRREYTLLWSDPKTGLQVRLTAVSYTGSRVVEWTEYFRNDGRLDSPILEDVQPLDISIPLTGNGIPVVLYSKGCGGMDTYALQKQKLNQLDKLRLTNEGGGKTAAAIPFFDIQMDGSGMIGAIGWPGQWAISMSRPSETAIAVRAGMEKTHLSLHPGEEIRTPQILLLPWTGDAMDAHNVLRRHILEFHAPHYDGKPVVLPISHGGWGGMKDATSLRLLDQITKENIGFENFWLDAGWYGVDRKVEEFQVFGREDWFLYAGDWRVNKIPHPAGLRPISDAVHAKGMKFLLWFEPERAVVGTPLTIEHPDWFIGEEGTNFEGNDARPFVKFRLFNFGNPAARRYMIDSMSDFITREGIDIYRQDCNFALAPFWAQGEAGDRQGITQIRYVEGLLEFWDELRRRHPQLILDIVQRGDLESITRAVDLTRADYPISPDADPIGNQLATQGLSYWRPHYGTALQMQARNNYHFRSGFAPGLSFALFNAAGTKDQVGSFIPADFPFDWLRTQVELLKRVRPFYYGDYYPLLPCSANIDCPADAGNEHSAAFEWSAWQFNRPEEEDGMVQAFRREQNVDGAKDLRLRGLDAAANYEVTNLDTGSPTTVSGKDLMQKGIHLEIPAQPGATIVIYKRVR
ncbi:MAG: alpha-galactosidase, partial [Acidobacteriaceae bacterium]